MPALVLFLDGVGLGADDPASNPFARAATPALRALLGGPLVDRGVVDRPGVLLVPTDARLGVPGLPQSATGQTALLTGCNAPAAVGRHITAYPTEALRALLAAHGLFAAVRRDGGSAALANTYSPEYFAALEARRLRMAAVTYAAQSAGVPLRGLDDLRAGRSVFHDLTNRRLREWGHDVPALAPRDAGRRLAAMARAAEMTFFEFFLTDLAAHGRIPLASDAVVTMVDDLVAGVLDAAAPDLTLLVVSDHGNLEDGTTTAHTVNPVPTLAVGPGREAFRGVRAITDIAPAVRAVITGRSPAAVPGAGAAGAQTGDGR